MHITSVSDPDLHGSAYVSPPGYGSTFDMQIRIQHGKIHFPHSIRIRIFTNRCIRIRMKRLRIQNTATVQRPIPV